jgi:site-specific recombinase XerD
LTRYAVRYLLRRYVKKATLAAPTLRGKKLHPHALHHSTAVALLKVGVDFATISPWLGHPLVCLGKRIDGRCRRESALVAAQSHPVARVPFRDDREANLVGAKVIEDHARFISFLPLARYS